MKFVRSSLEIHTYQQVNFKIRKQNAGSLNYTKAHPELALLLGVGVRLGGDIKKTRHIYSRTKTSQHSKQK